MASQIIISAELFSIPTLFPRDWRLTLRYVGLLQLPPYLYSLLRIT
jgi:hypothetical protein